MTHGNIFTLDTLDASSKMSSFEWWLNEINKGRFYSKICTESGSTVWPINKKSGFIAERATDNHKIVFDSFTDAVRFCSAQNEVWELFVKSNSGNLKQILFPKERQLSYLDLQLNQLNSELSHSFVNGAYEAEDEYANYVALDDLSNISSTSDAPSDVPTELKQFRYDINTMKEIFDGEIDDPEAALNPSVDNYDIEIE